MRHEIMKSANGSVNAFSSTKRNREADKLKKAYQVEDLKNQGDAAIRSKKSEYEAIVTNICNEKISETCKQTDMILQDTKENIQNPQILQLAEDAINNRIKKGVEAIKEC